MPPPPDAPARPPTHHPPTDHPPTHLGRHVGPSEAEIADMLSTVGLPSLDAMIDTTVPASIRLPGPMSLDPAMSETEALGAPRCWTRHTATPKPPLY